MTKEAIRVLIIEDHNVVRHGLIALINLAEGIQVVGEAADGVEAIAQYRKHQPDVTLVDLRLPKMGGVEVMTGTASRKLTVIVSGWTSTFPRSSLTRSTAFC